MRSMAMALFLLCIYTPCTFLHGQQRNCEFSITGTVVCSNDGSPLLYATVSIANSNTTSVSDARGKFKLINICPGNYHLGVFLMGYRQVDTTIIVSGNTGIKLELKPDNVHLDSVKVVSQKVDKKNIQSIDQA